ncbi:protein Daple isoform X2 [Amborella trichopoda]|uniref:protein Daple isoform X2 n=1 Tax=Amborella trichopoda TaxID=13333 RepID=UPI0009BFAC44|nr:protein Daple isoform X2 [Amborella trichopoda]|eukprot:XP_020526722.1 protein Daple isoform X2 [Amborella trichopoda]
MDNSPASQLPEAGSLPDGFVESTLESSQPMPLISNMDESSTCYREIHADGYHKTELRNEVATDKFTDLLPGDISSDASYCSISNGTLLDISSVPQLLEHCRITDEAQVSDSKLEKIKRERVFPVQLSDKAPHGACGNSLVVGEQNSVEHRCAEHADTMTTHRVTLGTPESLVPVLGLNPPERITPSDDIITDTSLQRHEGGVHVTVQCIDKCIKVPANVNDKASVETDSSCVIKPNTCKSKSNNGKHNSRSEKESIELAWKYQQAIAERDTAIAVREKLESLCRELQRQNKMLMDVSNKLDEQKTECLSQLKENEMLRNRLKHLSEQYAIAEQQFVQQLKKKSLEVQLAELKLQQHLDKSSHEQSQMQIYADQVSQLLLTEKNLRLQLTTDGEKFQQFQEALVKSNDVFESFKREMEKMAKSIKQLKKENTFLKSKCEKSDISLIELVEERESLKKQLEKVKCQKEKLESLCRSLQVDRKRQMLENNSEPGSHEPFCGKDEP